MIRNIDRTLGGGRVNQNSTAGITVDMLAAQSAMTAIINGTNGDENTKTAAFVIASEAESLLTRMTAIRAIIQHGLQATDQFGTQELWVSYEPNGRPYLVFGNRGPSYSRVKSALLPGDGTIHFSRDEVGSDFYFFETTDTTISEARESVKQAAKKLVDSTLPPVNPFGSSPVPTDPTWQPNPNDVLPPDPFVQQTTTTPTNTKKTTSSEPIDNTTKSRITPPRVNIPAMPGLLRSGPPTIGKGAPPSDGGNVPDPGRVQVTAAGRAKIRMAVVDRVTRVKVAQGLVRRSHLAGTVLEVVIRL